MSSTTASAPSLPSDVIAFAAEHSASSYLSAVVDLTYRVFPSTRIAPRLEADAEAAEEFTVVVEVDVTGLETSQLVSAQRQWSQGLFSACPPSLAHLFCLRMV